MPLPSFGPGALAALPLPGEETLWAAVRAGDDAARARLLEAYLPFAGVMAARMYAGRIEHDLDYEDYLQFGTIGLIEAADRYDPAHGVLFKTYAAHRINGAIQNGLEQMSEKRVQVSTRQRLRAERREGAVIAEDKDVFQQLADIAVGLAIGYLIDEPEAYLQEDASAPPVQYGGMELQQLRNRMQALVDGLPPRERLVIKYHYLQQLPFNLIAESMGLTKGRVSQIHSKALALLREAMKAVKACDVAW
ncbi:FliA/WhiG family RNA polymerase sigma factor [Pseudoduganella ginsengisoli]|nr:sigma-70 family RNA polymerase sigma factor [Pseudoduganella ginsengisoli]